MCDLHNCEPNPTSGYVHVQLTGENRKEKIRAMEGLALSHYVFMQPHVKKRLEFLNVDNLTVWEMWMLSLFCCAFAL